MKFLYFNYFLFLFCSVFSILFLDDVSFWGFFISSQIWTIGIVILEQEMFHRKIEDYASR